MKLRHKKPEKLLKEKKREVEKVTLGRITFLDNPVFYVPLLPFPQRLKKKKLDEQFSRFFNIFKKLKVNIPFAKALAQTPTYVKFIKEILSNKKKLDAYGTSSLSEICSAIIEKTSKEA